MGAGLRAIDRMLNFLRDGLTTWLADAVHGKRRRRWAPKSSLIAAQSMALRRDDAQACRAHAAADSRAAEAMALGDERTDLEVSAESWASRADLLDRLDKSFEKRRALDEARSR